MGDTRFWTENLQARDHSQDLSVDGSNIGIDLGRTGCEEVDWFHLAKNQWWALVDTVMNLRVP